jgi:outer membrane protein assembly factor BamB
MPRSARSRARLATFVSLNLGLLLLVPAALIPWSAAADWPQLLGPARNGISTETGLRTSWPRQGPPLLWQKDVGAGFSGPVVVGRRLILFYRVKDEEVVECLDALTGDRKWRFPYATDYQDDFGFDEGPRSTPTVAGSRVYTLGASGMLHCLDLATGKKVWRRSVMEEYQVRKGYFGVGTSPLVEGDLVLVNVGGKKAGIVAFHKDTGKEVWKATDDGASYSSPVAATVGGKRSVFFFTRRGLVVLDPRSGAVRFDKFWRSRMDASVNAATPVVVGDDVFVSACYGTGALLLHFGKGEPEEVWKGDEVLSNHYATSVHRAGYLYGFDGRQEQRARLRCVELKTGQVCWTKEEFGCGSMILADGQLIILCEDGDLVLVEPTPAGYREKARVKLLTSPCRAQLALADGRLYARDSKKLICEDMRK